MDTRETLMMAGGGTGGHIYPAIAIARAWIANGQGRAAVFVGTEYGLEKTIVPKNGFPLEFVSAGGLKGKSAIQTLRNLLRLPVGFFQAWRVISRHRPVAIVGVGGYASGPVLAAGALRRIPTLVHEANAYPGLTNRLLARVVRAVAVAFPAALPRIGRPDGVVTGNPIRAEFFDVTRRAGAGTTLRILIFGGSQGSRVINRAVAGALPLIADLRDRIEIVHQTGRADHADIEAAYRTSAFAGATVTPFIDEMPQQLADSDLVICRSGAMTVGELSAVGRAAILIPFAAATNNHQLENARELAAAGGAAIITESELTPERLAEQIREIVTEAGKSEIMGNQLRKLADPGATRKIVSLIEKIQRKPFEPVGSKN